MTAVPTSTDRAAGSAASHHHPDGVDADGSTTPTRNRWAVAVAAAGLIILTALVAFLLARYR